MVFGAFSEILEEARKLLCYAADATAARTWVEDGATSQEHAAALLKNRLYRRWGIKTARVCPDQDRRPRRAATRTSPTRPGTATTRATTTGSKLTYTLPTPLPGRQDAWPQNPN
jgi:hypothetical protein